MAHCLCKRNPGLTVVGFVAAAYQPVVPTMSLIFYVLNADTDRYADALISYTRLAGWLVSRVVNVLDSGAEGRGLKSQPRRCLITVLGKLFTLIVPLFTKQQNR